MLTMNQVSKRYSHRGNIVNALDDATFEIADGDFASIVGSSGSGKSTLLLMLGGMLSPTTGIVELNGESIYDLSPDGRARLRKENIGFVFQTFNLVPYLTALENVQVPMFLTGIERDLQLEKATALLDRVGLKDRVNHKPSELSVGQQQRVALARMLANDPSVILADEPTGNLDPETASQVIGFFEEFNQEGRTIVMVTHDPRAAERAKRTLKLVEGRVIDQQPHRTTKPRESIIRAAM